MTQWVPGGCCGVASLAQRRHGHKTDSPSYPDEGSSVTMNDLSCFFFLNFTFIYFFVFFSHLFFGVCSF